MSWMLLAQSGHLVRRKDALENLDGHSDYSGPKVTVTLLKKRREREKDLNRKLGTKISNLKRNN